MQNSNAEIEKYIAYNNNNIIIIPCIEESIHSTFSNNILSFLFSLNLVQDNKNLSGFKI